ncbi:MAG: hypothetical protein Q8O03_01385 [Nanoarchaeota archaeon]|nr:hypothetical protein [Nanoarchaeota archaeon]
MKIPKTFIPKNKEEINLNEIKDTITDLESIIPKSVNGFGCEEKIITEFVNNYYLYDNDLISKLVQRCYINIYKLNKMAVAKYDKSNKKIALMEHKTQQDLTNNLRQISEYLTDYNMVDRHDYIKKRLLFKDNILAWLDGDKCFIESAAFHYKSLGFEPFN